MGLFDRRRKSQRFIALALVCLFFIGLAFVVLARHEGKENSGLYDYNQERNLRTPVIRDGLKPPAPGVLPKKPPPMPKRYSFSTPFIWTLELFLLIYGLTAVVYLYKRYKTRIYRTR